MKKILLSAVMMTALFTACKKDDNKGGGGTNQWKIEDRTYQSATTMYVDMTNTLMGTTAEVGGSTLTIQFSQAPTSGTYYITAQPTEADELSITAAENTTIYIVDNDIEYPEVTVAVNGDKVSVTIPEVELVKQLTTDKVKFSGNLTQTQ